MLPDELAHPEQNPPTAAGHSGEANPPSSCRPCPARKPRQGAGTTAAQSRCSRRVPRATASGRSRPPHRASSPTTRCPPPLGDRGCTAARSCGPCTGSAPARPLPGRRPTPETSSAAGGGGGEAALDVGSAGFLPSDPPYAVRESARAAHAAVSRVSASSTRLRGLPVDGHRFARSSADDTLGHRRRQRNST